MKRSFKRFEEGGDVDPLEAANASKESQEIAASQEAAPKAVASSKPKVVSAKELADSGLSLRDYLNKQRGLTRRGDPTAGEAKDKAAQAAADAVDPGNPSPAPKKRYGATVPDTVRSPRLLSVESLKKAMPNKFASGGSVKGWGQARGARAAKVV